MGAEVGSRRPRQREGLQNPEITKFSYGVAIAGLLAVAALVLFSGCGSDTVREVDGRPSAAPSPLDFGVVALQQRHEAKIEVQNVGQAPLQLLAIEAVGEGASDFALPQLPSGRIESGKAVSLSFGFQPREEKPYTGKVRLITSSRSEPEVLVDLLGVGARPQVSCTDRLDFGKIVLNTDKVLRIVCVNTGKVAAPIRVVGVEGDDPGLFSVGENLVEDPTLVPAGASQLIEARYTASHLGKASARALIEATGAEQSMWTVELQGEGFASDLVASPNCLHFGPVNPGTTARRQLTVYNGGDTEVAFQAPTLVDTSGVFGIERVLVEGVEEPLSRLAKGEQAELTIAFAPTAIGEYAGDLQIRTSDPTNPRLEICLTGQGGGADIQVTPDTVDFGNIAVGMKATARVAVRNVGTPEGGPLRVLGGRISDTQNFTVRAPGIISLSPGDPPAWFEIDFHPVAEGQAAATLIIESNDGNTPEFAVPVRGEARVLPPCSWVAVPRSLDFGPVQSGSVATLALELRNTGENECIFSSMAMSRGTSQRFRFKGDPVGLATVQPGGSVSAAVEFHAAGSAGDHTGAVEFYVNDPNGSRATVPLRATVYTGCIKVNPGAIDFGVQRLSCPVVSRTIQVTNDCPVNVRIDSVTLGAGAFTEGEFTVTGNRGPVDLRAGQTLSWTVQYKPVNEGHDGAPLLFGTSLLNVSVPLHGEGSNSLEQTDTFFQREAESVDVLFVIDNSGSMMDKQQAVAGAFDQFIKYATSQNIDYHIGTTTTGIKGSGGGWSPCPGGVDGGEAGRLFPVTGGRPRYITKDTPNAVDVFKLNVNVGVCHWWEEGLEASFRALSPPVVNSAKVPNTPNANDGNLGFYRPDARLSVIFVTDEDDDSPNDPQFYLNFFRNLKGIANTEKVTVHGVLGNDCTNAETGKRYMPVIQGTGGKVESVCTSDWGRTVVSLAESTFGFRLRFPLSSTPVGAPTVRVNGRVVTTGWTWDPASNSVVFTQSTVPPAGARIDITYTPACGR